MLYDYTHCHCFSSYVRGEGSVSLLPAAVPRQSLSDRSPQGQSPASEARVVRELRELLPHLRHHKTPGQVPGQIPDRQIVPDTLSRHHLRGYCNLSDTHRLLLLSLKYIFTLFRRGKIEFLTQQTMFLNHLISILMTHPEWQAIAKTENLESRVNLR